MSAVPEYSKRETHVPLETFSVALRDATFVSAEGRIYRLFPEGESVSLDAEPLDMEPFVVPEDEAQWTGLAEVSGESLSGDFGGVPPASPAPCLSVPPAFPAPCDVVPPVPKVPIKEAIKRIRAVEGVCRHRQSTLPVHVFDALSQTVVTKTKTSVRPRLVTETNSEPRREETRKAHAASPIHREVTLLGRPLIEKEISDSVRLVLREESVPVLDDMPDFFNVRQHGAVEPTSVTPAASESEAGMITEPVATAEPLAEPRAAESGIRIVRLEWPRLVRRRRVFSKRFRSPRSLPVACEVEDEVEVEDPTDNATEYERVVREVAQRQVAVTETPPEVTNSVPETLVEPESRIAVAEFVETAAEPGPEIATKVEPEIKPVVAPEVESSVVSAKESFPAGSSIDWSNWRPCWPSHLHSLESRALGQIRVLCDHIVSKSRAGTKVVSFNGFYPAEGCTTMALCAARELSSRGLHVLLVDADARNPEIPRLLDIPSDPSFYEIILLENDLEFLPWSPDAIEVERAGTIRTKTFAQLVASLRPDFDLVLLDNGVLTDDRLEDRIAFWRELHADGVLLVVNAKNPKTLPLETVARQLQRHGIELVGIAENYV